MKKEIDIISKELGIIRCPYSLGKHKMTEIIKNMQGIKTKKTIIAISGVLENMDTIYEPFYNRLLENKNLKEFEKLTSKMYTNIHVGTNINSIRDDIIFQQHKVILTTLLLLSPNNKELKNDLLHLNKKTINKTFGDTFKRTYSNVTLKYLRNKQNKGESISDFDDVVSYRGNAYVQTIARTLSIIEKIIDLLEEGEITTKEEIDKVVTTMKHELYLFGMNHGTAIRSRLNPGGITNTKYVINRYPIIKKNTMIYNKKTGLIFDRNKVQLNTDTCTLFKHSRLNKGCPIGFISHKNGGNMLLFFINFYLNLHKKHILPKLYPQIYKKNNNKIVNYLLELIDSIQ